ncbi:unnamed protein product [Vicia faba]|uniref:Uncharacterized protein n=1 Tax=Vicia faba TaxID=3906 RepID=A0AAV0ZTP9_VICFA|nr:unnamed protein product [Vicia faba]
MITMFPRAFFGALRKRDFYQTRHSLAERYNQVKPDTEINHLVSGSPFALAKYQIEKLTSIEDTSYDTYSGNFDVDEPVESEIDDPEQELMNLKKEIKRINEENEIHRDQLKHKDSVCDEVKTLREENEAEMEQVEQKNEEKI